MATRPHTRFHLYFLLVTTQQSLVSCRDHRAVGALVAKREWTATPTPTPGPTAIFPPKSEHLISRTACQNWGSSPRGQPECPSHPLGRERRSLNRGSEACEREGHSPGWGRAEGGELNSPRWGGAEEEGLTPWWPARQAATRSFQLLGPRDLPSHMTSSRISWKMVGDPRQSQARPRCQCHQEEASRIQALPGKPEAVFRWEAGRFCLFPKTAGYRRVRGL